MTDPLPEKKLSDREELILQAVVHQYITTAEPVGSRALVRRYALEMSPATARNVMADLEELGYIQQLHTSSGRVPTDGGYRYYVNYLMRVQDVTQAERRRIEENLLNQLTDADEILRQTSQLLALISHQTGIVESPSPIYAEVRHIDLLGLDGSRVVLLIADNYGRVRTKVVTLSETLTKEECEQLTRFLNDNLIGTPTNQLAVTLRTKLRRFIDEQRKLAERAVSLLELVPSERTAQLFLEGTRQLFDQPEFRDVEKAREVLGFLEEGDRVMELLRAGVVSPDGKNLRVVIGSEAPEGMGDISVVAASYSIGDEPIGMLGVLGPRRMPYSRLTGVVQYTATRLSGLLTKLAG